MSEGTINKVSVRPNPGVTDGIFIQTDDLLVACKCHDLPIIEVAIRDIMERIESEKDKLIAELEDALNDARYQFELLSRESEE